MVSSRRREKAFLDARNLSLEEWLAHIAVPEHEREVSFEDYRFPTDSMANEYLASAHLRPEAEVKTLLRSFLIPNGVLGADSRMFRELCAMGMERLLVLKNEYEFVRRLCKLEGAWEGLTWILDLLPRSPMRAIDVLDSYYEAHCQFLPDGRATGISDAQAVIRQRFLTFENPREALQSLTPIEFELLVGALFKRMGYSVTVTPASGDGGVDVIAERVQSGARALILIQCKLNRNKVKVQPVRELTGVVLKGHANKGILVTNSTFTAGAIREAGATPTIELIGYKGLNELLNQNLGTNWPDSMAMFIRDMKRNVESTSTDP